MRSQVAPRLQFTAKLQASQAVGTQAGITQIALLIGDTLIHMKTASAFVEKRSEF